MLHRQNRSQRIILDLDGLPFLAEDFSYQQERDTTTAGVKGGPVVSTGTSHTAELSLKGAFIREEIHSVTRKDGTPQTVEARVESDMGDYVFKDAFVSYQPCREQNRQLTVELTATEVEVHN